MTTPPPPSPPQNVAVTEWSDTPYEPQQLKVCRNPALQKVAGSETPDPSSTRSNFWRYRL